MIVILMVAGVLALLFKGGDGPPVDAIAIFSIIGLFVVLGVLQEHRAQKAIAALKQMSSPTVKAVRDGELREMSARELVPGDLVLLETGSVVPADCRIIESVNLRIQEAALTGESEPIEKVVDAFEREDLPLGDRQNMAYMGTVVTYGRGEALVVATGMRTELGNIAKTDPERRARADAPAEASWTSSARPWRSSAWRWLRLVAVTGVLRGKALGRGADHASIAVAVVPEGLPAVMTITLALGAQRMLKRNALIRKLPAVETLGSVTVICSDKTGTLTENRMTVTVLDRGGPAHRSDRRADGRRPGPLRRPTGPAARAAINLLADRRCALQRRHPARRRQRALPCLGRPHRRRAGGGRRPARPPEAGAGASACRAWRNCPSTRTANG